MFNNNLLQIKLFIENHNTKPTSNKINKIQNHLSQIINYNNKKQIKWETQNINIKIKFNKEEQYKLWINFKEKYKL